MTRCRSSNKCQSGSDSFRFYKVPVNSDNPPVLEALQRFRKNEIARAFLFLESNHPKFRATFAFLDRHDPIVFHFRLQMSILRRFLPERVNFRLAGGFDNVAETFGLCLQELHLKEKSARELRQGGSNYRCCIPALAGFVSPQSIAPDGAETSA